MKRLFSFLLAAVLVFALTLPAFADGGGPAFLDYEAVISNPDGAYDSDEGIIIPYQAKITVTGEYEEDDGSIYVFGHYNEDKYFYISIDDISKVISKVGPDSGYKFDKPVQKIIINKNGATLRDGPANSYAEVGKVPYGTVVKATYGNAEYETSWIYVSYGNASGWMFSYDYETRECADIVEDESKSWVEIIGDSHWIYDNPFNDESSKALAEVPKGTKLFYKYCYGYDKVYVEYNGVKGWLEKSFSGENSFNCVEPCDRGIYTSPSIETVMYKEPVDFESNGTAVSRIPQHELLYATKVVCFSGENSDNEWYYINYDGVSGWIKTSYSEDSYPLVLLEKDTYKADEELNVYSEPDISSKSIGTISSGTQFSGFDCSQKHFTYVKIGNEYGWVNTNDECSYVGWDDTVGFSSFRPDPAAKVQPSEPENKTSEIVKAPEIVETTTEEASKKNKNNKNNKNKNDNSSEKSLTPTTIIILCALGAIVLALTAIVIVLLVNRKKKGNGTSEIYK